MSKNNSLYGRVNILRILSKRDAHVHFVGSSGVGMSSLLILSSYFGISVSGEDKRECECIDVQRQLGNISIGAHRSIPEKTTLLVYTLAVDDEHEALLEAEKRGIPVVSRAEYMSALIEPFIKKIAVAGTHGKSTTTAMLNAIFKEAALMPTTLCGAAIGNGGVGIEIGALDYLIYEACEYKNSFLYFEPTIALFLNLEYDHPDFFNSIDDLSESFLSAMKKSKCVILNHNDEKLREIAKKLDTPPIFFGSRSELEYCYEIIPSAAPAFSLYHKGKPEGEIQLSVIGDFNIQNAVGAAVVAHKAGIPFDVICRALSDFSGIPRRLEKIGEWENRCVYYDYAHHPTEIKAGIKGIKSYTGKPLTVIFSPHTYSRTKALWREFVDALSQADYKILTPISGIRERKIEGVSGKALALAVDGYYCDSACGLLKVLSETNGDIVIMGAADTGWIKRAFNL